MVDKSSHSINGQRSNGKVAKSFQIVSL
jgi:hypothetical protein